MKFLNPTRLGAILLLAGLSRALPGHAQARSFTTIKSVKTNVLSNGVQITILADGILQYRDEDADGRTMGLTFPDARNGTGKNFINLNSYPVSHLQLATPQGAQNGIGLRLSINNLAETHATFTRTPDGQGVLITVQSDRTLPQTRGGESGAGAVKTEADEKGAVVKYADGKLSLRTVKADIHELMGAIAQKSGLAVAVDDAVDRKISLNLDGVDPASAVRTIAAAYGLAFSPINGIIMLSEGVPTDLATYRSSETQSFRMQNTQAGTASGLLPNFLYSYVKVNAEQNAVVVAAPSQMLAKIGADLRKVDVLSPQILIEAIAVELSDTSDLDIGLRLGNPNPGQFASLDPGAGSITYNTIGTLPREFQATLRALELKGKARVRARPQMVVVNGGDANLFIGSQRFILTQFNQSGQTQNRIQPVDVGVKLYVKPLTGGNGEITTRIAPEVSNITELDLGTGLPVLSTRRSDTTVRVKDGETIAIGGLTLDQEQTRRGKIPFFGDLPLVGSLFRSRKKTTVRTELVVFVTPRIITANSTKVVNNESNLTN
ncbi:type II and III secretion system protein [bacterium]|nr:MAG: type II and III secretion system protein [bacterium]